MSGYETAFLPEVIECKSLDAIDIDGLKERLYTNHLVVIRNAGVCAVKEFGDFAAQLGELEAPLDNAEVHMDDPRVEIMKRNDNDAHYAQCATGLRIPSSFYWHADRSFLKQPSFLTATRVVALPDTGGATDFINTEQSYGNLSPAIQAAFLDQRGIHSYAYYHEFLSGIVYSEQEVIDKQKVYPPVTHPLVCDHPTTGSSVPYLSPLTLRNMPELRLDTQVKEGLDSILDEYGTALYRHEWQPDDIAIWDNFGVLHRGTSSKGDRELQRLTISLPA